MRNRGEMKSLRINGDSLLIIVSIRDTMRIKWLVKLTCNLEVVDEYISLIESAFTGGRTY